MNQWIRCPRCMKLQLPFAAAYRFPLQRPYVPFKGVGDIKDGAAINAKDSSAILRVDMGLYAGVIACPVLL